MSQARERLAGGAGGIVSDLRAESTVPQSVSAHLGVRGGAQKKGAPKRSRIGMWSEPVEGRGSDHSEKVGARSGQAKGRSITPSLPTNYMEKRV